LADNGPVGKEKWRFLPKSPVPVEDQHDAFSSKNPEKRERDQNNPADCKTLSEVDRAAAWLARHPAGTIRGVVPALRTRFDLTAKEACDAIRRAHQLRVPAR